MLTKFFEFCEKKKRYFTMALVTYAIVMTLGIFGDIGMGIGALLSIICVIAKEIHAVKAGNKISVQDVGVYMVGIIAGFLVSALGIIVA